jgi:hypothetical protein
VQSTKSKAPKPKSATRPNKEPKPSRSRAPDGLSLLDWQRGLRRHSGREQAFGLGTLFGTALAAAGAPNAQAHPWIERDAATGTQSLKVPLLPPETARRLADMLSTLADSLRG